MSFEKRLNEAFENIEDEGDYDEEYVFDKKIKINRNFDGSAYKVLYADPEQAPWIKTQIPGYVYLFKPDAGAVFSNFSAGSSINNLVYKMKLPDGILDYFPSSETIPQADGYEYNKETKVKPGWLATSDIAIITVPIEMVVATLEPGSIDLTTVSVLLGMKCLSSDEYDFWIVYNNGDTTEAAVVGMKGLGFNVVYDPAKELFRHKSGLEWRLFIHKKS